MTLRTPSECGSSHEQDSNLKLPEYEVKAPFALPLNLSAPP
jgi:hypothetical protein